MTQRQHKKTANITYLKNHYKCKDWKHMLDFPDYYGWDISRYFLACYCCICRIYFPKGIGKFCLCCHNHVRFKNGNQAITREMEKVYAQRLEEFKKINPDWVLIRPEILKPIFDLKILKGEI